MNWDDLKVLLAFSREGSFQGSAKALKVSYPTLLRSVTRLEDALGATLFHRGRKGYSLGASGHVALQMARRIEQDSLNLQRNLWRLTSETEGSIRVGIPGALGVRFFARYFKAYRDKYPKITIEAVVSSRLFGEEGDDRDVAIALNGPSRRSVSGVLLGRIAWAIYGHRDLVAGTAEGVPLAAFPWIGMAEGFENPSISKWMAAHGLVKTTVCKVDSIDACRALLNEGVGLAALPCCVGDASENLIKVVGPIPDLECELWTLTHQDMKRVPRVSSFVDFLVVGANGHRVETAHGNAREGVRQMPILEPAARRSGIAGFAENVESPEIADDLHFPSKNEKSGGDVST